jgi:hypothetical protein
MVPLTSGVRASRRRRDLPPSSACVSVRYCSADQPPSDARMVPLTLVPSLLSRKVMEAASCAALAGAGTIACISGPSRSAASSEPQLETIFVVVKPGATTLKRRPLGP